MKADRAALRTARGRGGFTMIEVMLAVALFAVSVVVLAACYVNVLNSLEAVKTDQALEQELAFVRTAVLLEPDLETVEKGGDVPTFTHGTARWSARVAPTLVADLFRVELTIELDGPEDATGPETITQVIHLLRPDWSQPVERDTLRAETRKRLDELRRTRPL